jgi:zinc transporter 1/2/3
MLSDANEKFESLVGSVDYPLGILLCGCGFILVLFLEKVMIRGEVQSTVSNDRPVYPIVLLLVLSVHSIIVGISLGLEKTLISSVVIFIAVISHKSSAAFALSVSLKNTGFTLRKIAETVAFFSFMTPLGIVLGAVFSRMATSTGATKIEGVFDALAAGTFLYIATLDIIQEVFEKREGRRLNFMLVIAGFGLMALIGIWT